MNRLSFRQRIRLLPIGVVLALLIMSTAASQAHVRYGPYPTAPFSVRVPQSSVRMPNPGIVYALPPGCAPVQMGGVVFINCSGVRYTPYFYGPNVVYAPVPPPYEQ